LIQTAQDLNRTVGATIRIAHAVPGEEAFPQRLWNAEFENSLKQQAAKTIQDIQSGAGTNFEVSIETGEVSRAIASCARRYHADLVLAGRGLDRGVVRIRSHTYAIIRDAACPVLNI
jgi:nucleotide-binding universal stress UspA family protein